MRVLSPWRFNGSKATPIRVWDLAWNPIVGVAGIPAILASCNARRPCKAGGKVPPPIPRSDRILCFCHCLVAIKCGKEKVMPSSDSILVFREEMDAVTFNPRFRLPSFSCKPMLGNPFFSLKEIADRPSPFAARKDFSQLTVLSIRADGNRRGSQPPQKNKAAGRNAKGDENKISQSSDANKPSNSKNQEEIIALFRRVQSSISKGESVVSPKNRSSNSSRDKPSAESVLEVFRQSRKQLKGAKTSKNEGNKSNSTRRRVLLQKVQEDPSMVDPKLNRPPSNFVKRSPIPFPSSPRKMLPEQKIESCSAIAEQQKLEEMKLFELKELAKTRGLRGYSRLKKSELVELLRC
ncbi:hypothetical protein U1Q18_009367 [Sarracenia purpurea var. burkii]